MAILRRKRLGKFVLIFKILTRVFTRAFIALAKEIFLLINCLVYLRFLYFNLATAKMLHKKLLKSKLSCARAIRHSAVSVCVFRLEETVELMRFDANLQVSTHSPATAEKFVYKLTFRSARLICAIILNEKLFSNLRLRTRKRFDNI